MGTMALPFSRTPDDPHIAVIRPGSAIWPMILIILLAAVFFIDALVRGALGVAFAVGAWSALIIALIVWLFYRPRIEVHLSGLVLINPFVRHELGRDEIGSMDDLIQLVVVRRGGRGRISAWGSPMHKSGRQRQQRLGMGRWGQRDEEFSAQKVSTPELITQLRSTLPREGGRTLNGYTRVPETKPMLLLGVLLLAALASIPLLAL